VTQGYALAKMLADWLKRHPAHTQAALLQAHFTTIRQLAPAASEN
jgi:hypothetical protein